MSKSKKMCGNWLYKSPLFVYNAARKLLLIRKVHEVQIIQRSARFVHMVELASELIEIREEVCGAVEWHLTWWRCVEQGKVPHRPGEALHAHVHVAEALIHVRRVERDVRLGQWRKVCIASVQGAVGCKWQRLIVERSAHRRWLLKTSIEVQQVAIVDIVMVNGGVVRSHSVLE